MRNVLKKTLSFALIVAVLLSFAVSVSADNTDNSGGGLLLFSDSVNLNIVVDSDCSKTELYAANVLKDYFKKMTGREPSLMKGSYDRLSNYIAIGSAEFTGLSQPAENGYIIVSDANGVRIACAGNKGASRGAYRFLEKYCGCHWYAYDCVVVPEKAEITVPSDINISYSPFFEYGECDTTSSRNAEFNVANGGSGGCYCAIPDEMGGTVKYISNFCHTLSTQYCAASKYYEEHPEYFALRDSKRVPDQLCLTNPDVVEIVKKEVAATIASNYNPDGGLQIISLTQNDNYQFCECEKCKDLDDANGSHAGTMVTFANQVAETVKNYTNIAIDTFAYQYTRTVPTNVIPADNVIIRLCSIECCFGHPLNDPDCKDNVNFMSDLTGWGKICNRVYVWDYVNNYRDTTNIFGNFGVLQSNVQTFYENGVKGLYEEGNYYIGSSDAEFGELKTYLLTRLIDNPYCDIEAEMDGFLEAYYGSGWQNIKEFIQIITDAAVTDTQHLGIYQRGNISLPGMSNADVKKCDKLWENAKSSEMTDFQKAKLHRSEISWRIWKSFHKKSEFSRWQFFHKWIKANDDLYNDMKELGIVQMGEGDISRYLSDIEILHYLYTPEVWIKGCDERAIVKLNDIAVKLFNFFDSFCK